MAALPSGSMISFKDAWQNIFSSTDTPPTGVKTATSLQDLSITLASSSITVADRDALVEQRYGIDEWWGCNYPSSQITDVLIKDTNNAVEDEFVDGETARVTFSNNTTNAQHTVTLRNSAHSVQATNTVSMVGGSAPYTGTTDFTSLALNEADGYYARITLDDFNNVNSPTFEHFDQIAGSITGVSTQYIDVSSETTQITHGLSTSAGTLVGRSWTFGVATDGDNEARTPTTSTNTNSPVVTYTGTGTFAVALTQYGNPSNARNYDDATDINVVINYNRQILGVVSTATQINHGASPTLQATSRGVSGTMRLGYGTSNSNTTYTDYDNKSVSTVKTTNDYQQAFTISHASNTGTSLTTYYPKAHYTTGTATLTAGSAISVAPTFSYSVPANVSINVNTTRTLDVSSVVGNGASVAISSSPNKGSGTNTATLTPLLANDVYTITYDGAANYSQTKDYSRTVTVNPTVSVAIAADQGDYPINDQHSDTITSATHGISPTIFTATPTVAGDTQTTFAWTLTSLTLQSGYATNTAGLVKFKKDSSGSFSRSLTVSGNSTSGTGAFTVTTQSITKAFTDAATSDVLRHGTTFTVTSIAVDYITRMEVFRANSNGFGSDEKVCNVENFASSINFSLTSGIAPYDTTARATYLRDPDNTAITISLGNHQIYMAAPSIDSFSASATNTLGEIYLLWTTSDATSVSIAVNIGTDPGSQAVDGNTTITALGNGTARTYTLTATNANGETTTSQASATTITPSVTVGTPTATSWTYGDIGSFTVPITKNFHNTIIVYMGKGMSAGSAGGTIYTTLSSQGSGVTSFDAGFNKTNFGGTDFGTIVDFKAYSAAAGGTINNNAATFYDFSAPGAATSTSISGQTGTSLRVNWAWPSAPWDNLQVSGSQDSITPAGLNSWTNGTTTYYIHTSLTSGTVYDFMVRTSITKTGAGVARVKNTDTAIFSGTTVSWSEIDITCNNTSAFPPNGGSYGWSTPEDAILKTGGNNQANGTLFYLSSPSFGSGIVNLNRIQDGADWPGQGMWYPDTELGSVIRIDSSGNVAAADHYAAADVPPKPPTGFGTTVNSTSSVTITWNNISAIEDNYIVYRKAGSTAPTTSSYDAVYTVAENATSYTNTGLSANTQYSWSVYAKNGSSYSAKISGTATTLTAPTVTGFTVSPGTGVGEIDLSWTTSNASNVDVWRSSSSNYDALSHIVDGGGVNSSFGDSGLNGGTVYYYRIKANGNGATSAATDANARATSLSVTFVSVSPSSWTWGDSGSVTITYSKNFTAAVNIYMEDNTTLMQTHTNHGINQSGQLQRTFYKSYFSAIGSNVVDFKITNTANNTTYLNQDGTATVQGIEPGTAPTGLAVSAPSAGKLSLSWNQETEDCTGYKVYMSSTYSGTYSLVSTNVGNGDTTHLQSGLPNSATRYFKVACYNSVNAGHSSYPNGVVTQTEIGSQCSAVGGTTQGGGGNFCFDIDSMVTMADNTLVRLGDLQIGDVVKSFTYSDMIDESDGPYEVYGAYNNSSLDDGYFTTSVVKEMHIYTIPESLGYTITFNGDETLKVSANHPVWVYVQEDSLWRWRLPSHIVAGDKLMGVDKAEYSINSVVILEEEWEAAYPNVETVDTCFVQGVLVHNAK